MMYCFQLIKGFSINPGINLTKEAWALWRYGSRQTTAFTSFFTALSTHFRKLGRRWPVRPRMWIGLSSAMKDRQTSLPSSLRNILVNDIFYSLYCKVKALRWKPRTDSRRTNLLKGKILRMAIRFLCSGILLKLGIWHFLGIFILWTKRSVWTMNITIFTEMNNIT